MNISSDLNTCVLNYVSGTQYEERRFWPASELQGFKYGAVFDKGTMNSSERSHQGKCFPKTNANSMTPAYISSIPEVCKLRYTWIFCVVGTEPSTNVKANR